MTSGTDVLLDLSEFHDATLNGTHQMKSQVRQKPRRRWEERQTDTHQLQTMLKTVSEHQTQHPP